MSTGRGGSLETVLSSLAAVSSLGTMRVERWIARAIGIIGLLYGYFALSVALPEWDTRFETPQLGALLLTIELLPLAVVVATTSWPRVQRRASLLFAGTFLLSILLWIALVPDPQAGPSWTWNLCTVASACAAQAMGRHAAAAYTVLIGVLVGVAGVVGEPLSRPLGALALMDAAYVLGLGLVVVTLIDFFRASVLRADRAARGALEEYRITALQTAEENERAEVDALVHDTVLAALHAAVEADSEQRRSVAAGMARDAITRLAQSVDRASPEEDRVPLTVLVEELVLSAHSLGVETEIDDRGVRDMILPGGVARALHLAAVQALTNSVQHAGAGPRVRRVLAVRIAAAGELIVEVSDNGVGFNPSLIPPGRLGVRVSIIARLAAVGGEARILSGRGAGTRVRLYWPSQETGGIR